MNNITAPSINGMEILRSTSSQSTKQTKKTKKTKTYRPKHRGHRSRPSDNVPRLSCVSCMIDVAESCIRRLQCSCAYCLDCLRHMAHLSIKGEISFPVQCHGEPVDIHHIMPLKKELRKKYQLKWDEHFMIDKERMYCWGGDCRKPWLKSQAVDGIWECTCRRRTCVLCGNKTHAVDKCPDDELVKEVREIGMKNGWRDCYRCNRLIVLGEGCNHMTCRCGAQFCYVCGKKWKTCPCDQWTRGHLQAEARTQETQDPALAAIMHLQADGPDGADMIDDVVAEQGRIEEAISRNRIAGEPMLADRAHLALMMEQANFPGDPETFEFDGDDWLPNPPGDSVVQFGSSTSTWQREWTLDEAPPSNVEAWWQEEPRTVTWDD